MTRGVSVVLDDLVGQATIAGSGMVNLEMNSLVLAPPMPSSMSTISGGRVLPPGGGALPTRAGRGSDLQALRDDEGHLRTHPRDLPADPVGSEGDEAETKREPGTVKQQGGDGRRWSGKWGGRCIDGVTHTNKTLS